MKISVIVPSFNEEKTIEKMIKRLKETNIFDLEKEIIVVDDGSKDNSRDVLLRIKDKYGLKLIFHGNNKGKGAAVRTGFLNASGDIIIIQDADLEYNPDNIPRVINPILNNECKVVYGSRFLGKKAVFFGKNKTPLISHWFGNKGLTLLTNILFFNSITDMETGYKAFRKEVIKGMMIRANRFDFEPEITAKIMKRGFKIKEVAIDFNPRTKNEGKKISWIDGVKAAYHLLKYRIIN